MAERSSRTSADELITQLVDHVFALSGQFLEAGDTITAPEGLSAARWLVLGALQDGPKTPAEIARRRGLARQSTVESVARLERSAHVARRAGSDRRTFLVELTDKGRRALSGIEPRRRAWATETAGQVETEQLEHAVAVLARLRAAPRPVDPFPPDAATSP
jgi:DNA-binding MarR family transcriptional regulator